MSTLRNPNPKTFAFELSRPVLSQITSAVIKAEDKQNSALASIIFSNISNVIEVYIRAGQEKNYLNIRKSSGVWLHEEMANAQGLIESFLNTGNIAVNEEAFKKIETSTFEAATFPEIIVQTIFTQSIQPLVQKDGGSIDIQKVIESENIVDVEASFQGACVGCASADDHTIKFATGELTKAFQELFDETGGIKFGKIIVVNTISSPQP